MDKKLLKALVDNFVVVNDGDQSLVRLVADIQKESPVKQLDYALDILYQKGGDPCSGSQEGGLVVVTKIIEGLQRSLAAAPSAPRTKAFTAKPPGRDHG